MVAMTCLTCGVSFDTVEEGRLHYKSDWHRYNLKRKVASLGPVTLEQFLERQKLQELKDNPTNQKEETYYCKETKKSFSSLKAFENHLQSKKLKEVLSGTQNKRKNKKRGKKQGNRQASARIEDVEEVSPVMAKPVDNGGWVDDDSDAESYDSFDEDLIGLEECLFSSHISKSLEANLKYMTTKYGFFLPDAQFIVDLEGLMTYLGEKVGIGHMCLWCGKQFQSTRDVQRHMVDKGHCKILYEGNAVLEYADFYDYTASYPDCEEPGVSPDDVVNPLELETDGFSLTLPSGATVGHRSLMHFYQQNLVPYNRESNRKVLPKMLAHYKALGWTGATGPQVEQRVKDVQFMRRLRNRYHMQLGCKTNKLQRYFRDPNAP